MQVCRLCLKVRKPADFLSVNVLLAWTSKEESTSFTAFLNAISIRHWRCKGDENYTSNILKSNILIKVFTQGGKLFMEWKSKIEDECCAEELEEIIINYIRAGF